MLFYAITLLQLIGTPVHLNRNFLPNGWNRRLVDCISVAGIVLGLIYSLLYDSHAKRLRRWLFPGYRVSLQGSLQYIFPKVLFEKCVSRPPIWSYLFPEQSVNVLKDASISAFGSLGYVPAVAGLFSLWKGR
jgi:hypothetical protein